MVNYREAVVTHWQALAEDWQKLQDQWKTQHTGGLISVANQPFYLCNTSL
jgi:hypothetical protein